MKPDRPLNPRGSNRVYFLMSRINSGELKLIDDYPTIFPILAEYSDWTEDEFWELDLQETAEVLAEFVKTAQVAAQAAVNPLTATS